MTSSRPAGDTRCDASAVLRDVAAVGPYFAYRALPADPPGTWRPYPALAGDPSPLADRIGRVARALGTGERVAASIAFQGLAARLVAAPFAAVVLHGVLPDLAALRHDPGADDPWEPGLAGAAVVAVPDPARDPAAAATALVDALDALLEPVASAVRRIVAVSPHILRGNVASSLPGAARVLEPARPRSGPVLREVLAHALGRGSLAGAGTLTRLDEYWSFRRRSCCLYYRVPGGGTCADCVLSAPRR